MVPSDAVQKLSASGSTRDLVTQGLNALAHVFSRFTRTGRLRFVLSELGFHKRFFRETTCPLVLFVLHRLLGIV
jgi:hypothetical protein